MTWALPIFITIGAIACIAFGVWLGVRDGEPNAYDFRALARWVGRWQEPLVWLPVLLAVLLVAYYAIPRIDPRAGIDGWGALWASGVTVVNAAIAAFVTWLIRCTYFYERDDAADAELEKAAATSDTWRPFGVLALDRGVWLATFALLFTSLQG
jgi:hypothetical protein